MLPLLLLFYSINAEQSALNEFDTYNADECQRVRRPWNALTSSEKNLYISGILKLRENGNGDISKDELVAIASEHMDEYGSTSHSTSSYLFWHGYLLYALESRIRNLGNEWRCFAMPYWDFSTEADRPRDVEPFIFNQGLGGLGDPDNSWTVNGYSWNITNEQYWIPTHCTAKNDKYPICSLKRATSSTKEISATEIGKGIVENIKFADFSRWYAETFNLPHNLLTNDETLLSPVVTSYDPIWYLFHSMVSYHQAMWTDCNQYDLIPAEDLDVHSEAYSTYCDAGEPVNCGPMELDDRLFFGGSLQNQSWSFIHKNSLTVRKSYHLPRWNVIYDLRGDAFYKNSKLETFCKGKLNDKWFILNEYETDKILDASSYSVAYWPHNPWLMVIAVMSFIGFVALCSFKNKRKHRDIYGSYDDGYGSI